MTRSPAVSVVMPVLAPHPGYFREAVGSVLGQSVADLELIIVEDPSESAAADVLRDLADPRIRHHRNPERTSLIAQRNLGLEMARADWIALLDADDVAEPERLEKQLAFVAAHPEVDVLGSQLTIIDGEGAVMGLRDYPLGHDEIAVAMRRLNPLAQSSVLARRSVMLGVGGYRYERQPCGEDYDLWCRMLLRGARFANHPEPLVRYRIQPDQLKRRRLREHLLCSIDIKETHFAGKLGAGDRVRLWAERGLLLVPPALVMRLFRTIQYRRAGRRAS